MIIKRGLPIFLAVFIGLLTLVGLVLPLPQLNTLLLSWTAFLLSVALLVGVLNLFFVHTRRLLRQRNLYSGILMGSMLAVFGLAVTDALSITSGGVNTVFNQIQFPLEAALASLMSFFLLMSGFQLLKRQRNGWSWLFILTAILLLTINILVSLALIPEPIRQIGNQISRLLHDVVATAGMRGLLIGIALGTVMLSIRLLLGMERPYNK